MAADRFLAEHQLSGDLTIGFPFGNQAQHLGLARSQSIHPALRALRVRLLAEQRGGIGWVVACRCRPAIGKGVGDRLLTRFAPPGERSNGKFL